MKLARLVVTILAGLAFGQTAAAQRVTALRHGLH